VNKPNIKKVFIIIILAVLALRIISIGVIWGILKSHIQVCSRLASDIFQDNQAKRSDLDGKEFGCLPGEFIVKFENGQIIDVTEGLEARYRNIFKKKTLSNPESLKAMVSGFNKRFDSISLKPCQDWYWQQNKHYTKYKKRMLKILFGSKNDNLEDFYFLPINAENNIFLALGSNYNHWVDNQTWTKKKFDLTDSRSTIADIQCTKIEGLKNDKVKTNPGWSILWKEKNAALSMVSGIKHSFKDKLRNIGDNQNPIFTDDFFQDSHYPEKTTNRINDLRLVEVDSKKTSNESVYYPGEDISLKNNLKLPFDSRGGYFLNKAYPFLEIAGKAEKKQGISNNKEKDIVGNIILTEKKLIAEQLTDSVNSNQTLQDNLANIDLSDGQIEHGISGYLEEYFKQGITLLDSNKITENQNVSILVKGEIGKAAYQVGDSDESVLTTNKTTGSLQQAAVMLPILGVQPAISDDLLEAEAENSKSEYLGDDVLNSTSSNANIILASEFGSLPLMSPTPAEGKTPEKSELSNQQKPNVLNAGQSSEIVTSKQEAIVDDESDALNLNQTVLSISSSDVDIKLTKDSSGKTAFASALEITNNSSRVVAWQLHNNQDTMYIASGGIPKAVPVDGFGFYEPFGGIKSGETVTVRVYADSNIPKGLYQGSYKLQEVRSVGNLDVQNVNYSLSLDEINNKGKSSLTASSFDVVLTLSNDPNKEKDDAIAFRIINNGSDSVGWQLKNNQDSVYTGLGGESQPVSAEGFGFDKTSGGIKPKQQITIKAYIQNNKPQGQYQGSYTLQEVRNNQSVDVGVIYYLLKVISGKLPFIQTILPKEGASGDSIRIYGKYFGDEVDSGRVEFLKSGRKIESSIVRWKKWNITCQVPKLSPGNYQVKVISQNQESNLIDFDVLK